MNLNSPLFDRIRTKPVAEELRAGEEPRCDHAGCTRKGEFRAPKGRDFEGQFFRFCMDHVREYNASYNYFAGMSDNAVHAYQKDAMTGHRPTWKTGVTSGAAQDSTVDAATLLRARLDRLRKIREEQNAARNRVRMTPMARRALDMLGLDENADKALVRKRFKEMAKRLHPDLNDGDRSREDKLRAIIDAYNYLKSAGFA